MKKLFYFLPLLALVSCSDEAAKTAESQTPADSVANGTSATSREELAQQDTTKPYGYYVGEFEAVEGKDKDNRAYLNRINISIDSLGDGKIKGHSVVAGNERPFSGTYEMKDGVYNVRAAEPGDDRYDGVFIFTAHPNTGGPYWVEGTWEANNKQLGVIKRKYNLNRKKFAYDASLELPYGLAHNMDFNTDKDAADMGSFEVITEDALKYNASLVKLTKENLENLYKGDLEVIRNAIYARHGYSFRNKKMRFVFDTNVDWYIPVTTDVRDELTELEKENIALIKRYEEHAEKYYDSYGR